MLRVFLPLGLAALLSLALGLLWGSGGFSLDALQLYWGLRAPRTFGAFACGGLLALSGALLQLLLRNPLAEPYMLGVSGGASVAVFIAVLLGVGWSSAWWAGAAGALLALALTFMLSLSVRGFRAERLLLTGVALAAGYSALIALLSSLVPPAALPGMSFWLLGDTGAINHLPLIWAILLAGLLLAIALSPRLDVLRLGDDKALSLGVNPLGLHLFLFLLSAALTATSVMQVGGVAFVGLIGPQLAGLLWAGSFRGTVVASVLAGGTLLVLADALGRSLIAPLQIPTGVLTAALGVPWLIFLLRRKSF